MTERAAADRASFAALLRRLRESRALTQEELAERAGITVKAVGALERGERLRPYPHTVRGLADALELDPTDRAALVGSVPPRAGAQQPGPARPTSSTPPAAGVSAPPTPFIGRDGELAVVIDLLRNGRQRLVSLTGPGGVGKTRLAAEVGARLAREFAGGCVQIELAAVREAAMVLHHLAAALGVPEVGGTTTVSALVPFIAGRRILVILDNVEQVLGCAGDLAELAAHSPDLTMLVTSRAPLRIRAEQEIKLAPLEVPDETGALDSDTVAASPAVQMFLDRAAAAGSAVTLTQQNSAVVAAICRRLGGLPLALELAAAGTRMLTPAALLDRLDEASSGMGLRDLPERHRTMTATLDWSYHLLEPTAQMLFARLGVFSGTFTLGSAVALGEDGEDIFSSLGALVDQSLVLRAPWAGPEPRFALLEPVRQYAANRLQRSPDATLIADRHADHFRTVACEAYLSLRGPGLVSCLDSLEADHANLRSAFLRLIEIDRGDDAAQLVHQVWLYLALRGHGREGSSWTQRLDPLALGDAARCAGLIAAAGTHYVTGEVTRMRECADTALVLARGLDRDDLVAEAAILAGSAAVFAGELRVATPLLDEAYARAERAGDAWAVAHAWIAQAQLALLGGDHAAADERIRAAEGAARELGNAFTLATALNVHATLTELRDEHAASAMLLSEAAQLSVEAGISWTLGYALPGLAGVAVRLGEVKAGARLFGASASLSAVHSVDPQFPASRALAERDLVTARNALGEAAFRAAWDAGRTATGEEIVGLARQLTRRAHG